MGRGEPQEDSGAAGMPHVDLLKELETSAGKKGKLVLTFQLHRYLTNLV